MLFFFKQKPIVVDAFCTEKAAQAYQFAPIDYATKFYPDWWKRLPKNGFDWDIMKPANNMKNCVGMTNEYQNSLIIPMWSDLAVKWESQEKWKYQYSDGTSHASSHPVEQRGDFKKDHFQLKITSPWLIESEKDILFQWKVPYYNFNEQLPYDVLPGTLEFYYQHASHINLLLKPGVSQNIIIKFGTPMVHLRPLSERKVVLKTHLITVQEYAKRNLYALRPTFTKSYTHLKKNTETKERKCPFGFGK